MLSKLAFVHRRLWHADNTYRLSVLFGPAPLLGAAGVGALWLALHPAGPVTGALPAWAKAAEPPAWNSADSKQQSVSPDAPLPLRDTDGFQGFQTGWHVQTRPVKILPTFEVDVQLRAIAAYTVQGPAIDMSQISANGPTDVAADPIFAGVGDGKLVVQTAGDYAIAVHLERPAGRRANCLERFAFGRRRILSNYDMNMVDDVSKTSRPARFVLQPGLYNIAWAFGCWDGNSESGQGRMTIMLSRPGESALHPLAAGDVVFTRTTGQQ